MKKTIAISLFALTTTVNAQIKIFPGGLQSYGSTTVPSSGEKHRFSGSIVVAQTPTSTAAAFIRGNNTSSSATTPDYTWLGNDQTGIFHPASNTIGFSINGTEKMRLGTYSFLFGSTTDDVGKIAVTADVNRMAFQSWSNYSWNGGFHEIVNVNHNATHAFVLKSTETGTAVTTYYLDGSGDQWAKTTTNWSYKNLKENIDTLQSSLSKIKQLKGVKYNFKASFVGNGPIQTELGLIAQDVELVIPEVVKTSPFGMKGIVYHNLIPVLIEAIKELDRKNTKLENDINACCAKPTDGSKNRTSGNSSTSDNTDVLEGKSYMKQNRPNPFNKETIIEYNIIEEGTASILVFDMNGKLLKTIPVKIPGKGSITINANDFTPGMYYYSLIVNDNEVDTKKMILTQ